jgi:hypothetical protein
MNGNGMKVCQVPNAVDGMGFSGPFYHFAGLLIVFRWLYSRPPAPNNPKESPLLNYFEEFRILVF